VRRASNGSTAGCPTTRSRRSGVPGRHQRDRSATAHRPAGCRSLNVALRQLLDLYVCLRPVQYFAGVPSPVKRPEKVNMVIFRENTEDIYTGIEFAGGSPESQKILDFIAKEFPATSAKSASARRPGRTSSGSGRCAPA